MSAVADLVGCGEDCVVGRAWFVVCVGARICMLLCTMEPGPRAPRCRALASEVAPLNADVYSGAAVDLVVAGFSRCEESPNKWQPASAAEL